jgi:hypothetical protein
MLTAGLVTQPSEFSFTFLEIMINGIAAGQVESYGSVSLLKGEGRKRLYNTVGGLAVQKGIDDRVQGHAGPLDVVTAVPLLDVLYRHRSSRIQYTFTRGFDIGPSIGGWGLSVEMGRSDLIVFGMLRLPMAIQNFGIVSRYRMGRRSGPSSAKIRQGLAQSEKSFFTIK